MYDSFSAHLMPLINSSFAPGQAQATVDAFQDPDQRQIAQAELYYFSGRAQECRNIAELYLQDKDLCLRLSAGLLYSFSNLTLGNPSASRMGFRNIQECLRLAEENSASEEVMASCVFAGYLATVLMHLPADGLPPLKDFLPYLPAGIRAYAIYILAHNAYLNEEYERALGLCQSVFLMLDMEHGETGWISGTVHRAPRTDAWPDRSLYQTNRTGKLQTAFTGSHCFQPRLDGYS